VAPLMGEYFVRIFLAVKGVAMCDMLSAIAAAR
jgi:hypothetical protein